MTNIIFIAMINGRIFPKDSMLNAFRINPNSANAIKVIPGVSDRIFIVVMAIFVPMFCNLADWNEALAAVVSMIKFLKFTDVFFITISEFSSKVNLCHTIYKLSTAVLPCLIMLISPSLIVIIVDGSPVTFPAS